MQRPVTHTAAAIFAGIFFIAMTFTALNTGDLVVRTFGCVCGLASMLAAEATWRVRPNAIKSVAIWSITAVVFGISVHFYARAYPVDAGVVTVANACLAVAVVLAVVAWTMRKNEAAGRRASAGAMD